MVEKERIQQRMSVLQQDERDKERQLQDLETKKRHLEGTRLRINGAIKVLGEMLDEMTSQGKDFIERCNSNTARP